MRKKDKIIIILSSIIFIVIAASVNIYERVKPSSVEDELTLTELEFENPTEDVEFHDIREKEETMLSSEEDSQISKLWFDLRNGENVEETFQELGEMIKKVLESGEIPQIVGSFPLLYVNGNEVGFSLDRLTIGNSFVELLTMVGPDSLYLDKVKHFLRKGTEVLELGSIPFLYTEYGLSNDYLIIGGNNINPEVDDLYTLVVINTHKMTIEELKVESVPGVEAVNQKGIINIKSNFPKYYLYEEFENEGVKMDPLFMILDGEDDNMGYKIIVFKVESGKLIMEEDWDGIFSE